MLIIGRTLLDWRAREASLAGIGFVLETDFTEAVGWPRSVLKLETADSDLPAVVPFRLTETVSVSGDDAPSLGEIVETIAAAHVGKRIQGERCAIHLFVGGNRVTYENDGTSRDATIFWEGLASWMSA